MNKIVFAFLLLITCSFGEAKWDSKYTFKLKKDEIGKIIFFEKGKPKGYRTYIFNFRWTLDDGQKITVLSDYRGIPRQHTLYLDKKLNTFRQILLSNVTRNDKQKTFLLLQVDEVDKKNKQISFLIYVRDVKSRFKIQYIDPKRKGLPNARKS